MKWDDLPVRILPHQCASFNLLGTCTYCAGQRAPSYSAAGHIAQASVHHFLANMLCLKLGMTKATCWVQALSGPLQPQSLGAAWPLGSRRGPAPTGHPPGQAGQPQPMPVGGVAAQQQWLQAQQAAPGALPAGGAALLPKQAAQGSRPTAVRPRAGGVGAAGAPGAVAGVEGAAGMLSCRERTVQ